MEADCAGQSERALSNDARSQTAITRAQELGQASREAQTRLADLRRTRQELQHSSETTRESLSAARARRASLSQILEERAYSADAVQKLFATNGNGSKGFRAVGLLADYAEVEEYYEAAIEQFLRDELEYVVGETFDSARAGVSLLRDEMGGRATFFVDSLRNLRAQVEDNTIFFPTTQGVISRLDRLVDFRDPLGPAAKQFLP